MRLAAKDLSAMKLPFLVLAVTVAASFLLVKFSSDKREKAELDTGIFPGDILTIEESFF